MMWPFGRVPAEVSRFSPAQNRRYLCRGEKKNKKNKNEKTQKKNNKTTNKPENESEFDCDRSPEGKQRQQQPPH
jgi:hypothetical protein